MYTVLLGRRRKAGLVTLVMACAMVALWLSAESYYYSNLSVSNRHDGIEFSVALQRGRIESPAFNWTYEMCEFKIQQYDGPDGMAAFGNRFLIIKTPHWSLP